MSRSEELFKEASQMIPGGVNSPVRSFKHVGITPVYFERAEGPYLFDVDGKQYVDFCLSFGPHILGHGNPGVVRAVTEQAKKAMSFGACHPKEVELARWVLKAYPFLERVRLVNSGTEATMTAVRIARGATNRAKIIQFEGCYHGHSDGFLAKAGSGVAMLSESSSKGVPAAIVKDTLNAKYDSLDSVKALFAAYPEQIAAIILEPVPANHGLRIPAREHLKSLIEIAHANGALVIFDEVISGFRLGLAGASGYYDLQPDIVTLGKILGGGLPCAAIAGRKEILDHLAPLGSVYQAGTLSGNPLATAAGCAVMEQLFANPPYAGFEFACTAFAEGLREILARSGPVQIPHIGSIFWIQFGEAKDEAFPPAISPESAQRYAEFFKKALAAGIYFSPSPYEVGFLSTEHTPEVLSGVLEKLSACLA
jgi:glutamate-1-semialdehyde 2,1-aminomutase